MAAEEFKPLKEIGAIPLSETSELKFYVDEYRGRTYASVRAFLKRESYAGPTRSGVTLSAPLLEGVIEALSKLPQEPQALEDRELGRFPKRAGLELVLRVTIYKDSTGIDLREWVDDMAYKGWSKKGVRIPYQELGKALQYLREMRELLGPK